MSLIWYLNMKRYCNVMDEFDLGLPDLDLDLDLGLPGLDLGYQISISD